MLSDESTQLLCGLAAGTVLKYAALRWIGAGKRREYVGKVSKVFIYPVKSVRELPDLKQASLTKHGLKFQGVGDRHWLVTNNGDMFTMKQSARLTLITSKIDGENLRLDAPDVPPLLLPLYPTIQPERVTSVTHWVVTNAGGNIVSLTLTPQMSKIRSSVVGDRLCLFSVGHGSVSMAIEPEVTGDHLTTVNVKNTPLPALDCGDEAAAWVSKVLQKPGLRLNYSAPTLGKRLSSTVKKDWPTKIQPQDEIAFQDFVHCMIMTESSMVALNKRLKNPVSVINFRPNLMIDGCPAFDEDTWEEVFIGEKVHLRYVDMCTRCVITCIDPETAIKDKEEQPLKELRTFRCMDPYGPKPCMGVHTCVEVEGEVKVGDPVYVVRK